MSKDQFEKLLNQTLNKRQKNKPSDEELLSIWKKKVNELYKDIKDWLSPYISDNKIVLQEKEIEVIEESYGIYRMKRLDLRMPKTNIEVKITPIGADVIGAYGRVDIEGEYSTIKLILVDEKSKKPTIKFKEKTVKEPEVKYGNQKNKPEMIIPELVWKIATPPPNVKYIKLNSDLFYTMLFKVSTGDS